MPRPLSALVHLVALVALIGGTMLPTASASATTSASRAMWVWSAADPASVVSFAQSEGVTTIFVATAADVASSGDLPRLQQLATRARAAGIRLDALGGDPSWTTDHNAGLAWQSAVVRTGLFTGIHVDVEPYALAGWSNPSTRSRLVTSYLGLLSTMHQHAMSTGNPLEVDVPFWYNTIPTGGSTLADGVLARVDAVSVMSYRNQASGPNSISDIGADMVARAGAVGRPVRLAAETNPTPDCANCSFFGRTDSDLHDQLGQVDQAEASATSYAGMAVEDYDGWRALSA